MAHVLMVGAGAHGLRRPGPGEEFWQYRPAQPGEPARAIDWRRSARSDALRAELTATKAAERAALRATTDTPFYG